MLKNARGVTLTELMVAVALLSVGILGFFGAFSFITKAISVSRARTLSTNLAQERVEALKNLNYYSLLITTASAVDNTFTPGVTYDNGNYPPETISIGGVNFKRYTYVALAQIDSNVISTVTYTYPDTGMKQITVHVVWDQQGTSKKWTLSNILENPNVNPLDASFSGIVSSGGATAIGGAVVRAQENPDWNATTDSTGYYSFRVYHGSYTIRASSGGWYDTVSVPQNADSGSNVSLALSMVQIASGNFAGSVWVTTNPVISQVVAASNTYGCDGAAHQVEYIELFNPTTYTFNVGTDGVYPKAMSVSYYDENSVFDKSDSAAGFNWVYVTTHVPPGRYYLLANASSFLLGGNWRTADAYTSTKYTDYIRNDKSGAIQITAPSGEVFDTVGWSDIGNPTPPKREGAHINLNATDGIGVDKQIVRVSSPGCSGLDTSTYGRAYDSDSNELDFVYEGGGIAGIVYSPRNTTDAAPTVIAGRPGIGAYVGASDPYSGSTRAYVTYITSGALSLPVAKFVLPGVTTGTWSVVIATGAVYKEINVITSSRGFTTWISSGSTNPAWRLAQNFSVYLDSANIGGFVEGRVANINGVSLSNITVLVGGTSKVTGSNGTYFAKVSSGPVSIIANPNNANSSYIQSIVQPDIQTGQIYTQDFTLSQGGVLTGYATTGTTPLPNIVVTANISGSQYGTGTTDSSGVWTIRNLSTATYVVQPVLEAGQDSSPNSFGPTVTAGGTIQVGTFTISGAFGAIAGTVSYLGTSVTSGALILASTATIASTPPSIAGSSAPAQTPMYAVSSKADGTYTLPVRGGSTYKLSVYIPVIAGDGTVSITTKSYTSGISVSPSLTTTQNITVP